MYNVMSPKAEEFISDEEIRDCLDYAQKNKSNRELIEKVLERGVQTENVGKMEEVSLGSKKEEEKKCCYLL